MRRTNTALLSAAGLALALVVAGCGTSNSVTGEEGPVAAGNAVLQGTVTGAGEGLRVSVSNTNLSATVDEEGQFALTGVPAGTVNLHFDGGGANARLTVEGLQDHQVTSINVTVSGAEARHNTPPSCGPTAETYFTGQIASISLPRLVVSARVVDGSQVRKVWRGNQRITLEQLAVGEKVKVWGTLRADGTMLADEIWALTAGEETWFTFTGVIEACTMSSGTGDVHFNPNNPTPCSGSAQAGPVHGNPNSPGSYPTLIVSGRKVYTSSSTHFRRGDGTPYDPSILAVGMTVYVEGWKKTDDSVRATLVRL